MTLKLTNQERAKVLVQALPHINKYWGKIVVVKYGGHAMTSDELREQVMEDIVLLTLVGIKVVLVHGGGPDISDLMDRLGKESQFVDGLRVTDAETVDIVQMVLAGRINKGLVGLLGAKGGRAIGLSGVDDHLIEAEPKNKRLGYVGDITHVNTKPITDLLELGYIPVISTVGSDKSGQAYNINGDTAAASIAGALGAERLIMMTDIAGILRDASDPDTLIGEITLKEATQLFREGIISGGMIPKVECCIQAIVEGVHKVIIMDGTVPHAILMELLTNEGAGTMVWRGEADETPAEGA